MAKPLVLRLVLQLSARLADNLGLTKLVNAELRESSAVTRGGRLVYVDADELPRSDTLSGRYCKDDDKVKVDVYIFEDDHEKAQYAATGKENDLPDLAMSIVERATSKLGK